MFAFNTAKCITAGCLVAGVLLLAACDGRTSEEVIPESGCRLENYAFARGQAGPGQSYVNEKATYTYDARGNLLRADTLVDGGEATYTYRRQFTSQYTYDAAGFLTTHTSGRSQQYTHTDGHTEILQQSLNIQYTYAGGRLSGYVSVHSSSRNSSLEGNRIRKGTTTRVEGSYAYDAAGNLLTHNMRRTYDYLPPVGDERPLDPPGTEMTWVYHDNQLVDLVQNTGGVETHPATIVNGLLTRKNGPAGYTRYAYDGQERLIRSEEYQDNQLISTYVREWTDGRPPSEALPPYKGFPAPKPVYGRRAVLRKYHFTWAWSASGIRAEEETTYFHQFNAEGFVTATTSEGRRLVDADRNQYQNEATPEPTAYTYRCR
jgi:YD repeat-containing protein